MFSTESSQPRTKTKQHVRVRVLSLIRTSFAVNPILTLGVVVNLLVLVAALIGIIVDPRIITGVPAWVKPSKFAISISVYSLTLLWFMSFIKGHKRLVAAAGNSIAIALSVEMALILTQVIRGTTSHFNISTPFDTTLWALM